MKKVTIITHNNDVSTLNQLFNHYFIILCFVVLSYDVCTQLFNTASILYVESLGGSIAYGGILNAAFPLGATITRIVTGRIINLKGRQFIALIGLVILAISSISFEFFPWMIILVFFRFLQGVGFSLVESAAIVMVTDVVAVKKIGEGIGYLGIIRALAQAFSPAITIWLISAGEFGPVFYLSFISVVVGVFLIFSLNYEKIYPELMFDSDENIVENEANMPGQKARSGFVWNFFEKKALPSAIIQFFSMAASACTLGFLMLFAIKTDIEGASKFFMILSAAVILGRFLTGKLISRYTPLMIFILGFLMGAVGFVLIAFSGDNHSLFFGAGFLVGLCNGLTQPILNAEAIIRSPKKRRSQAISTYLISIDLGVSLGVFLWGMVIELLGFQMMFFGAALLMIISLLFSVFYYRKDNTFSRVSC